MVEKRSKYSPSVKEKTMSMFSETSRIPQENFVTEFLSYCNEYKVDLSPKCVIESDTVDVRLTYRFSQFQGITLSTDPKKLLLEEEEKESGPILHLTYENPRKLETLRKLECKDELPNCRINAYGIMQISCILKDINCLRDLNLDRNPNVQENYHLLCKPCGNLLYLSLKLCEITDEGVTKMMNELEYADVPNEPKLLALNLANNHITDRGAMEIARMLRTNRSLQSLVLAGNIIYDDGAGWIIQELNMSQLTHPEIVDLRRRRYNALILREKMFTEMRAAEDNEIPKIEEVYNSEIPLIRNESRGARKKSKKSRKLSSLEALSKVTEPEGSIRLSRNSVADTIPDIEIDHPFGKESSATGGVVKTNGNFTLRHLNMSFNRLTGETLDKLLACLRYQAYTILNDTSRGLLYVSIEGNEFEQQDNKNLLDLEELLRSRRSGEYLFQAEEPEDTIQN